MEPAKSAANGSPAWTITETAEASLARSNTFYTGTANRDDVEVDASMIPALAGTSLTRLPSDDDRRSVTVRVRLTEAGNRTSELVSTGQRYVMGLSGMLSDWDYEVAINHSSSTVSDRDHQGYLNEPMVADAIASGVVNAFGPSDAAGLAVLSAAQIRGEVRRAVGFMDSIDGKISRGLMKLEGGDLALALGGEFRRERQNYHQSQALADDIIMGEVSQGPDADFGHSRKVAAVFAELDAPVTKQLDLSLAARYEYYQATGGATSPKIGLKYMATPDLLFRASAGTGFRAPTMSDLYRPVTESESATLADPVCMAANDNDLTYCAWNWTTRSYSNPKLKPERSRQFSLGAVMAPTRNINVSLDYWNIQKKDLISNIGTDVILNNLAVDPCQGNVTNATTRTLCTAQLQAVGLTAATLGNIPAPIAGQINVTTTGNPNLDPERARTLTLGAVFQPSFIPGLSATFDWYRIRVTGAITSPTVGDILNGCFGQSNAADPRCQLILRNPLTGGLSGSPATTGGVVLLSTNQGFLETEGYDFTLTYDRQFGDVRMGLGLTGNYTDKSRFQSNPNSFIRECAGYYSVSCDPVLPEWTWNARLTGAYKAVDVSLLWRHIGAVGYEPRTGATATTPPAAGTVGSFGSTNPAVIVPNYRSIDAFDYFDLNVGFDVMKTMRLSFLVENLFDKAPPEVGNTIGSTSYNSGNTFPSLYDAIGRRFTVAARLKF